MLFNVLPVGAEVPQPLAGRGMEMRPSRPVKAGEGQRRKQGRRPPDSSVPEAGLALQPEWPWSLPHDGDSRTGALDLFSSPTLSI